MPDKFTFGSLNKVNSFYEFKSIQVSFLYNKEINKADLKKTERKKRKEFAKNKIS